jgi:hypothetical protein
MFRLRLYDHVKQGSYARSRAFARADDARRRFDHRAWSKPRGSLSRPVTFATAYDPPTWCAPSRSDRRAGRDRVGGAHRPAGLQPLEPDVRAPSRRWNWEPDTDEARRYANPGTLVPVSSTSAPSSASGCCPEAPSWRVALSRKPRPGDRSARPRSLPVPLTDACRGTGIHVMRFADPGEAGIRRHGACAEGACGGCEQSKVPESGASRAGSMSRQE